MKTFTRQQLAAIRALALGCKFLKGGERSVYRAIKSADARVRASFSPEQMQVIKFCAEECRHQESGELSVYWMLKAWNYALQRAKKSRTFTEENVLVLGALIEPKENKSGFRHVPVTIKGKVIPWEPIERGIANLLRFQDDLACDEVYAEYEKIHPYKDGNGRSGKVLFNWKNGTLSCPVFPAEPDFG